MTSIWKLSFLAKVVPFNYNFRMPFIRIKAIVFFLVMGIVCPILAEDGRVSWSQKMRETAKVLIDGFPYLYSKLEFRDPKNKKRIASYIQSLKENIHELPTDDGKSLLGSDPLIDQFNREIPQTLNKALDSFSLRNYDLAQQQVRMAIHKCVACHTAYQMGPYDGKTNDEVVGIPLDSLSKFEVSIALRQFNSALFILESEIGDGKRLNQSGALAFVYLRMHLLVSVRSLQDNERALRAINSYAKNRKNSSVEETQLISLWKKDIAFWQALKGLPKEKLSQVENRIASGHLASVKYVDYVLRLLQSFLLHQSLIEQKDLKDKTRVHKALADCYRALDLPILSDLSVLYGR